jgi:hypothetical protein
MACAAGMQGAPCLNHLHFPSSIRQTQHTHPSGRYALRLTVVAPRLTVVAPRLTVVAPRLTVVAPRLTVVAPRLTVVAPRLTIMAQLGGRVSEATTAGGDTGIAKM